MGDLNFSITGNKLTLYWNGIKQIGSNDMVRGNVELPGCGQKESKSRAVFLANFNSVVWYWMKTVFKVSPII
jgi:hypothetical protein